MPPPWVHTTGLCYQHPTLTAMLCVWMYTTWYLSCIIMHRYVCMYITMYTFATEHYHYLCIQHSMYIQHCVCSCAYVRMDVVYVHIYVHVCTPFCNLLAATIRVNCTLDRVVPCSTATVCYLITLDLASFCINMRTGRSCP